MSDTTAPTPSGTVAARVAEWGPLVTTIIFGGAFVLAVVWAYIAKDEQSKTLLLGAVIANANTAAQWWLGSSSGSQKKDAVLGAMAQAATMPAAPAKVGP